MDKWYGEEDNKKFKGWKSAEELQKEEEDKARKAEGMKQQKATTEVSFIVLDEAETEHRRKDQQPGGRQQRES